jgi:P-type Ca2+ transporter type 2C
MTEQKQPYYLLPVDNVLHNLRVRQDLGLTAAEVKKRHEQHGLNYIPRHKPRSALLVFLDRFADPLVIFLIIAAGISIFLGELPDAIIIAVAIIVDAILSFFQVWRTQRTLDRLRQHVEQQATVLREGEVKHIAARELTIGDIIEVRAGQKVPADARLTTTSGLRVQESALTGESEDAAKSPAPLKSRTPLGSRSNMLYLGTTVMNGEGQAVVVAVGPSTEFGKIAQVLKTQPSPTSPLRRKLQQSGQWIAASIVALVLIISGAAIATGETWAVAARLGITLVVSAIPEDLTIILTIALTVGVIRILKQKGVVRELSSGETLGAATVICTDKTGTLTEGNMTADQFDSLAGRQLLPGAAPTNEIERLAYIGFALACDAHRASAKMKQYIGSATERTALAFVEKSDFIQSKLRQEWRMRDGIPFNTKWKYRASLHDHPTKPSQILFVSGAPEIVLEHASRAVLPSGEPVSFTSEMRHSYQRQLVQHASQGKRLIALAVRDNITQTTLTHADIKGLTFLGILTISDPIRPEVVKAIHETQSAGVAVKLITGDFAPTAQAVARAVGLSVHDDTVITGDVLQDLTDDELARIVDDIVIFARVEPLDKQRIVRALQKRGHIVAMTGDGVNDAVALNSADIGVAMGSGKDIAKDAAKLILLDDNFTTIVEAIREGRVIRDNVRKVIGFLLATNAAEVTIFVASQIMGLPLPLLPAQILWINLVTDGTSDIALSLEPQERTVMSRPPEDPTASLINQPLVLQILLSGLIMTAFSMSLYVWGYRYQGFDLTYMRTVIFSFVAVTALLSTWSYRSLWEPMWRRGFTQNRWLFASAGFSFTLQLAAIYTPALQGFFHTTPLRLQDWGIIIGLALLAAIVIDVRKSIFPLSHGQAARRR